MCIHLAQNWPLSIQVSLPAKLKSTSQTPALIATHGQRENYLCVEKVGGNWSAVMSGVSMESNHQRLFVIYHPYVTHSFSLLLPLRISWLRLFYSSATIFAVVLSVALRRHFNVCVLHFATWITSIRHKTRTDCTQTLWACLHCNIISSISFVNRAFGRGWSRVVMTLNQTHYPTTSECLNFTPGCKHQSLGWIRDFSGPHLSLTAAFWPLWETFTLR